MLFYCNKHLIYVQDTRSSSSQSTLYQLSTNCYATLKRKALFTRSSYSEAFYGFPLPGIQRPPQISLDLSSFMSHCPPQKLAATDKLTCDAFWLLPYSHILISSGRALPRPQPFLVLSSGTEAHIPHKITHDHQLEVSSSPCCLM